MRNEKPQTFYLRNFSRELRIENDVVLFCARVVILMKTEASARVCLHGIFRVSCARTPEKKRDTRRHCRFSGKVCPSVKSNLMVRV